MGRGERERGGEGFCMWNLVKVLRVLWSFNFVVDFFFLVFLCIKFIHFNFTNSKGIGVETCGKHQNGIYKNKLPHNSEKFIYFCGQRDKIN